MQKQSKNNSTNFLIPESSEDINNNQLENKNLSQNITIDQVAEELSRISQLDNILDSYFKNNNTSNNLNSELDYEEESEINIAKIAIKETEINYIINNSKSNTLQESDYEHE